jgi:MFS family permease
MDLYCTSSEDLGLLGTMFFAGAFVGSFFLPRLADIIGRRPIFMIGLSLYFCAVAGSIFCQNLYLCYFIIFVGGVAESARYYVAFVYCLEFM